MAPLQTGGGERVGVRAGILVFPWQENHGKSRKSANAENHGNHGKSRKRKLKFLVFTIVVARKPREITETEMKVPAVY